MDLRGPCLEVKRPARSGEADVVSALGFGLAYNRVDHVFKDISDRSNRRQEIVTENQTINLDRDHPDMIIQIQDNPRADEPEATRSLSKAQLFKTLSSEYFLPDKESRAMSRAYLVQVFENRVYRVHRHTILQFEAELQIDEVTRSTAHNITIVIERTNILLQQLGLNELGFRPSAFPDEGWLMRIVRHLDPTNLLNIFFRPVRGAVAPNVLAARV